MIKIENIQTCGWSPAIRGMRNPMNSWDKLDSDFSKNEIGPNDLNLAKRLSDNGPVHGKFKRMITVYMDITAPLYWWKEYDTYKVATVANSCSTMHKIHEKKFTFEDFSHENLFDEDGIPFTSALVRTISMLNEARKLYLETKDKKYWNVMIQLLPSSYNQKRTVMFNYETASNIFKYRHDHKLKEWQDFCEVLQKLPYANDFIV